MKTLVLFAGAASFAGSVLMAQDAQHPNAPSVRVIQGGDSAQDYRQCRRMLVGPGVNQPDPYGQAVELSDGSIWAAYIHTGGHATKDAKTEALWSIRLRVRRNPDGIELLPAPGAQDRQ